MLGLACVGIKFMRPQEITAAVSQQLAQDVGVLGGFICLCMLVCCDGVLVNYEPA